MTRDKSRYGRASPLPVAAVAGVSLYALVFAAQSFSANTVFADGREVACKAGSGKAIVAMPDVCFTPPQNPATPPGVPIPYPNTGKASDTDKGTKSVKVKKSDVQTKGDTAGRGSERAADNPGKVVQQGKAAYTFHAMDVKFEGEHCARFLELPASPFGWKKIAAPFPLLQTADGKTRVECAGKLHDTTVIPAPAPKITYVDPPPFEGFVVPYRSGRIPSPEEVAAYRANPEAADARIEADIDIAAAIYAQEREKLLQLTAGARSAVDAKIDAYNLLNPEYDNHPITGVEQHIGMDGLYEDEIFVHYGTSLTDIWVQEFDLQGDPIGRPVRTPQGNVLQTQMAYTTDYARDQYTPLTSIDGDNYTAKVVFPDGGGYYLFNENGEAYWGEIYDVETGNRTRGLFAPEKFPTLSDRGPPLVRLDYVQLAQTDCPLPCQAVTDVYNALASEMNLIIREMNMHADKHAQENKPAQEQEANYEAYLRAEAAANPLTGPEPGEPASTSVIWYRARYEGLLETLLEFEPRLAQAKRNLEACQCPGTAPSPLLAADTPLSPYRELMDRTMAQFRASLNVERPAAQDASGQTNANNTDELADWAFWERGAGREDIPILDENFKPIPNTALDTSTYALGDIATAIAVFTEELATESAAMEALLETAFEEGSDRYIQNISDAATARWAIERVLNTETLPAALNDDTGPSTLVAIIDTGVDIQHPALLGSTWANPGEIPGNGVDDDGNGLVDDINGWNFVTDNNDVRDTNGHGTLVAGLVAARGTDGDIRGINPRAQLMVLKVANYAGKGNSIDIGSAVTYAANNGARVINISLGGEQFSEAERIAVDYALEKGAVVVVASGNQGSDAAAFWPAALPGVITVAATTRDNARANYSNWGTVVDIAAPGSDVVSLRARYTDPMLFGEGEGEYEPYSNVVGEQGTLYLATGTSFAAPLVSGAASLLWADNPALTGADVQRMLLHSAQDLALPGPDILTGYGLLDVAAARQAEPAFFIESRIVNVQVAQRDGKAYLQLLGTADANEFRHAAVRFGAGEAPQSWRDAGKLDEPVREGVLAEIDAAQLAAQARWTVQLEVAHRSGQTRLAQFDLKLR